MLLISLALELTILLSFWLCLGVWTHERSTAARQTFLALALSGVLWCVGALADYRQLLPELWSDRLRYLGVLSLPAFWAGLLYDGPALEAAWGLVRD